MEHLDPTPIPVSPDLERDGGQIDEVEQAVNNLRATYDHWVATDTVPQRDGRILGVGSRSTVYGAGEYAERVPNDGSAHRAYLAARNLAKGAGLPCLEQAVALSETSVWSYAFDAVAEDDLTSAVLQDLTLESIEETLVAFDGMQERGLGVDGQGEGGNILIGKRGVGIVDYIDAPNQRMEDKVGLLARVIGHGGMKAKKFDSNETYRMEYKGRIEPLQHLLNAVQKRYEAAPAVWAESVRQVQWVLTDAKDAAEYGVI